MILFGQKGERKMDLSDFLAWDINEEKFRKYGRIYYNHYKRKFVGFKLVYLMRKAKKKGIFGWIYKKRFKRLSFKCGVEISYKTQIGRGFVLGHPNSIVITSNAVLGENVHLTKGVLIGLSKSGRHVGSPSIGNNVFIGANAVVVGGISIGDNVFIASNAFVNFDVPANSIVIGNPAIIKPIKNHNPLQEYIKNYEV